MALYRDRSTGELKSQGALRKENKNMSLPKVWNSNTCEALNVDEVLISDGPTEGIGKYQVAQIDGAEKNSDGKWVQTWKISDMFSDQDGGPTKAEQETTYQNTLDREVTENNRSIRNDLLKETDWWGLSDTTTMTSDQTNYRKALRDITAHSNWPNLEESDWPTKP